MSPVSELPAPFSSHAAHPLAASALPKRPLPWLAILAGATALAGVALRLIQWRGFNGTGFDEFLYRNYLEQLLKVGLTGYPDIVDSYMEVQKGLDGSILPPTRFLYIFFAYLWHGLFGGEPLACFHAVSRCFSVGSLALAGGFAFRLLDDRRLALAVFALMAFSPLQIHMSQHALVDGFFEFWVLLTLWSLWECLRAPGHRGWLAAYTVGLATMVMTKENSFFVFVGLAALLASNHWLRFGTVTRPLLVLTVAGPLIGVAVLTNLAGGLPALINVYRLGVPKNLKLPYAIATGDGPWFRYWLDLLMMSPLVFVLATGRVWQLRREDRALWYGAVFIAATYLLMCNVKYGMNLRYATIWDFPLRVLAAAQVSLVAGRVAGERWRWWTFTGCIIVLCAVDLAQYHRLAVEFPLYELIPKDMLRALKILK